jgi:hypothetical protein
MACMPTYQWFGSWTPPSTCAPAMQGCFGVSTRRRRVFRHGIAGADFDIKDTPLDIEVLRSAAAEVKDQLPILQTAQVRELRGGIPTMTADGHHILGPAPGVANGGRGTRSMDR